MPDERRVTAPDGQEWTIRRHWLHRPRRWPWTVFQRHRASTDPADSQIEWLDGLAHVAVPEDGWAVWLVTIGVVAVAVIVCVVVVVPVLTPRFDTLIIVGIVVGATIAAIVAIACRVLFRRPWRITARSGSRECSWGVIGSKRGHEAIHAVADSLASGNPIETVDPTRAIGAAGIIEPGLHEVSEIVSRAANPEPLLRRTLDTWTNQPRSSRTELPRADLHRADLPRADLPSARNRSAVPRSGVACSSDSSGWARSVSCSAPRSKTPSNVPSARSSRRTAPASPRSSRSVGSGSTPSPATFRAGSKPRYTLTVHGLVDTPYRLTYDELIALPPTHLDKDFQCVTGWRVTDVEWKGVLLSDLLDRAGVQDGATALRFTSFDGTYTESLTLEQARRSDVIVAYQLEGDDISSAHGGPVRLYVAPMYGYKSIKWLDGIEADEAGTPRILGRPRLRRRRMDRTVQWSRRRPGLSAPILRFGRVERSLHWVNATLFFVLMITGAFLYVGPLSAIVGRRELVRTIHVYCGIALPIPLLIALVGRHGARLRQDFGELNRFAPGEVRWFRPAHARVGPVRASSTRARSSTRCSSVPRGSSCSAPGRS